MANAPGGYRIRVYADIDWVPAGAGGAALGQSQSQDPGYGQAANPGAVGVAQTRRYQAAESVPGGNAPTLANILTALQSIATDLAGATGTPIITAAELAIIQGWASGNP